MRIRLNLDGTPLTATLADNATARDFASLLPLTLTLTDYADTEKISDVPKRLFTQGAPAGSDPSLGDIAYYAPWGNLAVFYRNFGYSAGLVKLGTIDAGVEVLQRPGPLLVDIALVEEGRCTVSAWPHTELQRIAESDDLHIGPFREDGRTYGTPTWIWSVVVEDALYVRPYNGKNSSWYQAAVRQKAGRIRAAGMAKEVRFELVEGTINDRIDEAYQKHWHGAAPTTSMSHIAIQEQVNGKVVEWMEKVSDEQYRKDSQ
jgi:hypothetical protein